MSAGLKLATKLGTVVSLMVALAFGVSVGLSDPNFGRSTPSKKKVRSVRQHDSPKPARKAWNRREDGTPMLYGDGWFDDSGYFFAVIFTGAVDDPNSLEQVGTALSGRAARGVDYLRGVLAEVPRDVPEGPPQIVQLHLAIGGLFMYQGDFDAADREFEGRPRVRAQGRRSREGRTMTLCWGSPP